MIDFVLTRSRAWTLSGEAAIAVVAGMIAVLFAGSTILTPLYAVYAHEFGVSQITLTLIYAVYVVGNMAALLVFGRMSDTVGRRRTALIGLAVGILGALVFLAAQGIAALFVGRILSGLGIGIGVGTGTAWVTELIGGHDKTRATGIATVANFVGVAAGAAVTGLLAQYAPDPLRLPFLVHLVVLGIVTVLIAFTRETLPHARRGNVSDVPLRPRIALPAAIRARFVAPALAGFATMALIGFYAALTTSILANDLDVTNLAVAGALFFQLAVIVSLVIVTTQRRMSGRAAMMAALMLLPIAAFSVVAAQVFASMALMIVATAAAGVAAGLGYRGSLQMVNQIAPPDRRAEVVSTYFVCCFLGNAVPVIGIGIVATMFGMTIASLAFAAMIVVFIAVAIAFGYRHET